MIVEGLQAKKRENWWGGATEEGGVRKVGIEVVIAYPMNGGPESFVEGKQIGACTT